MNDPVFGPVKLDDEEDEGCTWIGEAATFLGTTISVSARGDESGPSDESRAAYQALGEEYESLGEAIAKRLCDNADPKELAKLADPAAILDVAKLTHVAVEGDEGFDLVYELPWDPEHAYCVVIEGGDATDAHTS